MRGPAEYYKHNGALKVYDRYSRDNRNNNNNDSLGAIAL
jgi:hypothetical protein